MEIVDKRRPLKQQASKGTEQEEEVAFSRGRRSQLDLSSMKKNRAGKKIFGEKLREQVRNGSRGLMSDNLLLYVLI